MVDQDRSEAPETLSEEALDQASGGLLPAHTGGVNVAPVATPTAAPQAKFGDGSVKPGGTKGYEAWPC